MGDRVTNITSMSESAQEERDARLRQYALTMAIRSLCVVGMVVVRGPFIWVFAAGAIVLPWIAVVFANHLRRRRHHDVERPGGELVVTRPPVDADAWRDAASTSTDETQEEPNDEFR